MKENILINSQSQKTLLHNLFFYLTGSVFNLYLCKYLDVDDWRFVLELDFFCEHGRRLLSVSLLSSADRDVQQENENLTAVCSCPQSRRNCLGCKKSQLSIIIVQYNSKIHLLTYLAIRSGLKHYAHLNIQHLLTFDAKEN